MNKIVKARKFLEDISSKDKVLIIHHNDVDGYVSALILYRFLLNKGVYARSVEYEIGKTNIKRTNYEKFDIIIITDIALNVFYDNFSFLKGKKVLYIDHHPREKICPSFVIEVNNAKRGYIPSSRLAYEITLNEELLGVIGTIGDAGHLYNENKYFIKNVLRKNKISLRKVIDLVKILANTLSYFKNKKEDLFEILSKCYSYEDFFRLRKYSLIVEKEIKRHIVKFEKEREEIGPVFYYFFKPKYDIIGQVSYVLSSKYKSKIIIMAYEEKGLIHISARNQSRSQDMGKLLKICTKGFPNSSAGGHIAAAGATIMKKDINLFKKNLENFFK